LPLPVRPTMPTDRPAAKLRLIDCSTDLVVAVVVRDVANSMLSGPFGRCVVPRRGSRVRRRGRSMTRTIAPLAFWTVSSWSTMSSSGRG
jgi:hypothetical protein